ncbi:MAG TPA: BrnT family toxin [Candidatus Acidoferrales bacterium]|nr:BrnT family toxin [Candidatus Acidoferrales bacterium]
MRFHFDARKSKALRKNAKRGIGFEEAQEIFSHPYYEDRRSDVPEQYRAIGWAAGQLYSLVFEVREDREGEFYHLVTLWKATKEERTLYEKHVS